MKSGDPIWYRQTCRGGYGFQRDVPGLYLRETPRRTVVLVGSKAGLGHVIAVAKQNVRPRAVEASA